MAEESFSSVVHTVLHRKLPTCLPSGSWSSRAYVWQPPPRPENLHAMKHYSSMEHLLLVLGSSGLLRTSAFL